MEAVHESGPQIMEAMATTEPPSEAVAAPTQSVDATPQPAVGIEVAGSDVAADRQASKREYVKWTPQEEEIFYTTLKTVAGQKPETCLREICKQLTTKDYAQVRHYYYRLIKRLNKILGPDKKLDPGEARQVHQAMTAFWNVFVDKGMCGTCMVGLVQKPRKQRELSSTVQRGVEAALRRGKQAEERAAGAEAKAAAGRKRGRGLHKLADADAAEGVPPGPKRRTTNRSRQAEADAAALAAAQAGAAEQAGMAAGARSETGGVHEASAGAEHQPSGSHMVGSGDCGGGPAGALLGTVQLQHISTANSFRSSSQGASGGALGGGKLQLRLVPLGGGEEAAMAAAGYNPYLELTCSNGKSVASVLRHLSSKWQHALPQGASMCVHPGPDCPIGLRGIRWGGPSCDQLLKVGDIYVSLMCPSPFLLFYSWCSRSAAQPAPSSSSARLQRTASAAAVSALGQQPEDLLRGPTGPPQQLQAVLRQAISAAAEGAAAATSSGEAAAPALGQQQGQAEPGRVSPLVYAHLQQQQQQSFTQMLLDAGGSDVLAAHIVPGPPGAAMGLHQFVPPPAALQQHMPALLPPMLQLPLPHWQHPLAMAAMQPPAPVPVLLCPEVPGASSALPLGVQQQQQHVDTLDWPEPAGIAAPAGQHGAPAAAAAAAAEPVGDPHRPRGLLGLLQPEHPAAKPPAAKRRPRRPPAAGSKRGKKAAQPQQQAALAQHQQQQMLLSGGHAAMPVPAGMAYLWAQHAQQHQPSVLQQPAQLQVLQQPAQTATAPATAQQQQQQQAPSLLEQPGDSLLHLLEGAGNTCSLFPGLTLFGTPGLEQPEEHVPPLPGSGGGFSLRSWASLSPPSNFHLPEGFNPGVSPGAPLQPGVCRDAAAAGALGPTDFSRLMGALGQAGGGSKSQQPLDAAAPAGPGPPPLGGSMAVACGAVDALIQQQDGGQLQLADCSGAQAQQQQTPGAAQHGGQNADPNAAPPALPEGDLLNELTFEFGSLLGVGDTPSWLGAPPSCLGGGAQPKPQQQAVGERPFAALFSK